MVSYLSRNNNVKLVIKNYVKKFIKNLTLFDDCVKLIAVVKKRQSTLKNK